MFTEPDIFINGKKLTEAEAMTVRVALQQFAMDLQSDEYQEAIKDHQISQDIANGYINCVISINNLI